MINSLVEHGANPAVVDNRNQTAYDIAIFHNKDDIAELFSEDSPFARFASASTSPSPVALVSKEAAAKDAGAKGSAPSAAAEKKGIDRESKDGKGSKDGGSHAAKK